MPMNSSTLSAYTSAKSTAARVTLDHIHRTLQTETQRAEHGEGHHGRAMDAGSTMNEYPRLGIIQRLQRELDSALEQL